MQLAKSTDYPDMGMVYSFLRLPGLVHRIDYAVQTGAMDEWIASSFVQFLSAKDAEKTVSGILTTATATFSSFHSERPAAGVCGDSPLSQPGLKASR
jgi:type IV secretory pathway TraG/TraD family ATPase VirD4